MCLLRVPFLLNMYFNMVKNNQHRQIENVCIGVTWYQYKSSYTGFSVYVCIRIVHIMCKTMGYLQVFCSKTTVHIKCTSSAVVRDVITVYMKVQVRLYLSLHTNTGTPTTNRKTTDQMLSEDKFV